MAAPAPDAASSRPLFQRLCARRAAASAKAAALAGIKESLRPLLIADPDPAFQRQWCSTPAP
jgi:hypothetical protein